ncbi:MAG: hypothetical protein M3451_06760 [Chloroflexota bacterium]|nr:hypothetical protein [Chloroflexota bacterium]
MPRPVLIACLETMDLVPTGVEADDRDELEPRNVVIDCPSCSQDHDWTPDHAVIVAV